MTSISVSGKTFSSKDVAYLKKGSDGKFYICLRSGDSISCLEITEGEFYYFFETFEFDLITEGK